MDRNKLADSEPCANIFEYSPAVPTGLWQEGVALSTASIKIVNLSAPVLPGASTGPELCVAGRTESFDLWGRSHIQFWNSNFTCKIWSSGNTGLYVVKATPKGELCSAFRCKTQRPPEPPFSVNFVSIPYRHLSLRLLISALQGMVNWETINHSLEETFKFKF